MGAVLSAGPWGTETKSDGHDPSEANLTVEVSPLAVVIGRENVKGRERERKRVISVVAVLEFGH